MSPQERTHLIRLRDIHIREQGGRCYFCGCQMTDPHAPDPKPDTAATIEHLKGKATGGGSNILNTAASCRGCNQKRSKQAQVGRRTVPRVKPVVKRTWTYGYTVPSDPQTLRLFNGGSDRDTVMLALKQMENQPITLKSMMELVD